MVKSKFSKRYRCITAKSRKCPSSSVGNYVERFCEVCMCTTHGCLDIKGNKVDKNNFPFLTVEECRGSCKSERCSPTGKTTSRSRYACECIDAGSCINTPSKTKKKCNCVQCFCDSNGGKTVCRDSKGVLIPGGELKCKSSLNGCLNSCSDRNCPTWTKWGCLESRGPLCIETNEREKATECVKCTCREVEGINPTVECTPERTFFTLGDNTTTARGVLSSANFNTREECEEDRRSPYGSCKSVLCVGSTTSVHGISNTSARRYQTVAPPNLGIRKSKKLNVSHLVATKTDAGRVMDDLPAGSVYNNTFNFSSKGFGDNYYPEPVRNRKYPDIFNNTISPVVSYFLEYEDNPNHPWRETYINELINSKECIKQSLNPDLNLIFNNLTYQTGKKIDPNDFYSGIIELLLTGNMSEFDPGYYRQVYDIQSGMEISEYIKSNNNIRHNGNIALGIIAESLVSADPRRHSDAVRHHDFMVNTKPFNTDIKAEIPVKLESGDVVQLKVEDVGISVSSAGKPSSPMSMGDGDGYYFPVQVGTETYILEPSTQIANSYFTCLDALDNAVSLLGENSDMKITVSSSHSIDSDAVAYPSEFESTFSIPTTTSALYFALNVSAISSKTSPKNPLIHELKCPYTIVNNFSDATNHSIEAGTRVTEVFLHYNDPFRTYLENSGKCDLDLINMDFHAFVNGKAPMHGEIIVRGNVPKALIFIPAVGSKYNPFHAKSKIDTIDNHADGSLLVSRSCEFVPYLEQAASQEVKHASTRKYTFPNLGTLGRGPLGVLKDNHPGGEYDVDASYFTYELSGKAEYKNLFYSDGTYTSDAPSIELPPTTKVAVNIIGDLKSKYKYTHFTWWDIFRRLKMSEYAALQLEMVQSQEIIKALENGMVTGGTMISNVLAGPNESNTGLKNPNDSTIYLTELERQSLLYDGTIVEDVTYLSEGDRG